MMGRIISSKNVLYLCTIPPFSSIKLEAFPDITNCLQLLTPPLPSLSFLHKNAAEWFDVCFQWVTQTFVNFSYLRENAYL